MQDEIAAAVEKLHLGTNARHVLLCVGGKRRAARERERERRR